MFKSFIYLIMDENYYPNLKIYKNGNIQITGIKEQTIVKDIIELIIIQIKKIYEIIP